MTSQPPRPPLHNDRVDTAMRLGGRVLALLGLLINLVIFFGSVALSYVALPAFGVIGLTRFGVAIAIGLVVLFVVRLFIWVFDALGF